VEGQRVEARVLVGTLDRGTEVVVVRRGTYGWIVEAKS